MTSLSGLLGLGFLFSEVGLAWRKRSSREPGSQTMDDGSLALLWRVTGAAITVGIVLAVLGVGPRLPHLYWGPVSLSIFAVGTALRWWAIWFLGKSFTVDVVVAENQRVVDTGPYRWIRHPSYTGLLMQFTALGLALGYWISLAVVMAPITWVLLRRIRVEESALTRVLGEPYQKYISDTKRLVPLVY